ncbi:glutathione S-transferase family protein [Mesorhizobium sp. BR1-1-16]|uniref:glutathione S-transferase family protein n=1 Tax=Mesorhizobium sp. BR1-1-16 TaxID=2876653 RepID=UPI001CC98FD0|nr:glutathione S-transferase family protein [Mesorhizobium sp. BR1-1-16]MBZ9938083.1 glutathione S-transferase family protein [Mesorhizobium sp. BR1-1-16]
MSLVLHDYELDADCYMVRLFLSILGITAETIAVDVHPGHEQRSPVYLALNPRGSLPILVAGDLVLTEAEAILCYLARSEAAGSPFLPDEAAAFGAVMSWLFFARGPLGAATAARLTAMLEAPGDPETLERQARAAFRVMEDHMTSRHLSGASWFVGDGPTLADIALFPPIVLSRDFGIDHDEYPALRRWMRRMRTIPGFITMPGIPDYH